MLESLEKLREYRLFKDGKMHSAYFMTDKIIDEIQAEIDVNYMELPKDADGMPIHVGDVMCSAGIREKGHRVIVSALFEDGFVEYGSVNGFIGPLLQEDWVHVKPRTLEDVLRDYACDFADSNGPEYDEEITRKYANEIRELLGGDA